MLQARENLDAAKLLDETPFELWSGTNYFNDEYNLLYLEVDPEKYVELERVHKFKSTHTYFQQIARALSSVGVEVRFIAVGVAVSTELPVVPSPALQVSSDSLERALRDAEHLIKAGSPSSAVDRIHTAFHAYLKTVCLNARLDVGPEDGVTHLFKMLRTQHSALQAPLSRKILTTMASVVDTINAARNNSSLAHPNDLLLDEPEAMLVINSVRTMLHYLDDRLSSVA
jgi:hypothetical protein